MPGNQTINENSTLANETRVTNARVIRESRLAIARAFSPLDPDIGKNKPLYLELPQAKAASMATAVEEAEKMVVRLYNQCISSQTVKSSAEIKEHLESVLAPLKNEIASIENQNAKSIFDTKYDLLFSNLLPVLERRVELTTGSQSIPSGKPPLHPSTKVNAAPKPSIPTLPKVRRVTLSTMGLVIEEGNNSRPQLIRKNQSITPPTIQALRASEIAPKKEAAPAPKSSAPAVTC